MTSEIKFLTEYQRIAEELKETAVKCNEFANILENCDDLIKSLPIEFFGNLDVIVHSKEYLEMHIDQARKIMEKRVQELKWRK